MRATCVAPTLPRLGQLYALFLQIAGAGVQWLRDKLQIIDSAPAIGGSADGGGLVDNVDETRGLYFVPAFTGLFAPYWRDDARGLIIGADPLL